MPNWALLFSSVSWYFYYRESSYASAVLAVVILSARPTHACFVTKPNNTIHCGYFDTTQKGNHSSFLTPTVVGGRRPIPSELGVGNRNAGMAPCFFHLHLIPAWLIVCFCQANKFIHSVIPVPLSSFISLVFRFFPSSSLCPFAVRGRGSFPQIQLRRRGSLWAPQGFRRNPADKRFLVYSELKFTLPEIALLQQFSDSQICTVTDIGLATYRYGISQKRSGGVVSNCQRKWQGKC